MLELSLSLRFPKNLIKNHREGERERKRITAANKPGRRRARAGWPAKMRRSELYAQLVSCLCFFLSFSVFAGHQAAYLVDIQKEDVLFWPADIGWITGLVWNVYGLLLMGSSAVIYDGALDFPTLDRVWKILSHYDATIFGISPTAVRLFSNMDKDSYGIVIYIDG